MNQTALTIAWIDLGVGPKIPPQTPVLVLEPPTVHNIQLSTNNLATFSLYILIAVPALGMQQFEVPFDKVQLTIQTELRPH